MNEQEYKLDRTAFKAMTVEEADDEMNNYKLYPWKKRLEISAYLNSVAFNYSHEDPPRIDKHLFIARSLNDEQYF